jgi:hypothetical protein
MADNTGGNFQRGFNVMGNCRDCTFWNNGECERAYDGDDLFSINVNGDDYGVSVTLRTAPEFGCMAFVPVAQIDSADYRFGYTDGANGRTCRSGGSGDYHRGFSDGCRKRAV